MKFQGDVIGRRPRPRPIIGTTITTIGMTTAMCSRLPRRLRDTGHRDPTTGNRRPRLRRPVGEYSLLRPRHPLGNELNR